MELGSEHLDHVWPSDIEGHFKTRDGRWCYALTVTDHDRRRLVACRALPSTRTQVTKKAFRRLFREAGLPELIRTDNGAPFYTTALRGLFPLSEGWMKLGIVHHWIHPGSPQENGQHERMHKDLEREATRPLGRSLRGQQRKLDRFGR